MGFHGSSPHRPVDKICYSPIISLSHLLASIDAGLATIELIVLSLGAEAVLLADGLELPTYCPISTKDPRIVLNPSADLGGNLAIYEYGE